MKGKQLIALLLTLALALGLFAGCSSQNPLTQNETTPAPTEQPSEAGNDPAKAPDETSAPADQSADRPTHISQADITPLAEVTAAESYEAVLSVLYERYVKTYGGYRNSGNGMVTEAATEAPAAAAEDSAEGGAGGYGGGDYGTNVQVAGIDEADSVKTDGDYLYILDDLNVRILKADGADTAVVGYIESGLSNEDDEDGSTYYYSSAILLQGDRLALLYTRNTWGWNADDNWEDHTETHLAVYDISDRTQPKLLSDAGQDGYYNTARMKDGTVYLVTNQWVYDLEEDSAPETYIPRVCSNGSYTMLDADHIYICPQPSSTTFTVVGSYELSSGTQTDACAFTDYTGNVYMNADALYLTRSVQSENASEPYTENQYTVVDYVSSSTTEIKRIPLEGQLAMDKSVQLEGALLNQFSMDVYNGYLRVATTERSNAYSIFTDPNYGWQNYLWQEDSASQSNRVTIFDGDLNVVGELKDLAQDEQIYSVRFLGNLGYVVTYKSIDPVFTIDLSDPANPTLQSALELPGVSQYLHLFSDGRLFGFGQALDENSRSDGLQLSMFDVSDPKNVSLEGKTILEDCYSNGLYNHHAILVSGSENLIGFPLTNYEDWGNSYQLYSYDGGSFNLRGKVDMDYFPDEARGIPIDGMLYICSAKLSYVIDLTSFEVVAELSEAVG